VLAIDFDAMLARFPRRWNACSPIRNSARPERVAAIASGPVVLRYSKDPAHGYSPILRAELLAGRGTIRLGDSPGACLLENLKRSHHRLPRCCDAEIAVPNDIVGATSGSLLRGTKKPGKST